LKPGAEHESHDFAPKVRKLHESLKLECSSMLFFSTFVEAKSSWRESLTRLDLSKKWYGWTGFDGDIWRWTFKFSTLSLIFMGFRSSYAIHRYMLTNSHFLWRTCSVHSSRLQFPLGDFLLDEFVALPGFLLDEFVALPGFLCIGGCCSSTMTWLSMTSCLVHVKVKTC
jgi:hypothetical protein